MEVIVKKFQTIIVGAHLMSKDYGKWLHDKGYELHEVKMGEGNKIDVYVFKLTCKCPDD
jgi:hypothetical protein